MKHGITNKINLLQQQQNQVYNKKNTSFIVLFLTPM